jgi:hypothetical protein
MTSSDEPSLSELAKNIESMLATIRGALLTTRSQLPLSKLGLFALGVAFRDGRRMRWAVSGAPSKCITTVLHVDGVDRVMYRDAWEGEYK